MASRDLDYSPLTGRLGPGERLRVMAGDNLKLVGMTVLALVTLGFGIAFVAAVVSGNLFSGFGLFTAVFLLGCLLGWGSEVRRAGKDGRFAAFARANGLELLSGESAEHYRGSLFADGSHVVRMSVRTSGESFVEVGERWPVTAPRMSINAATNAVSTEVRTPELFLRARLKDRVRAGVTADQLVSPELDAELATFAGRYAIELSGREVTVFGSRELDPETPGRMPEAFGLVDRLVAAADAQRADAGEEHTTSSGVPIPELAAPAVPRGQKLGPLTVVGLTLALLIVVPLLFAVVMSMIDDGLRGHRGAAQVVVGLFIALVMAVVAGLVRLVSKRRSKATSGSRALARAGAVVGALAGAFVVLVAVLNVVSWLRAPGDEELLNQHYREKIELRDGHVVIDGDPRRDCTVDENGWLSCAQDPQPTYE